MERLRTTVLHLGDTPDADQIQIEALRRLTPIQRFHKACALSSEIRRMAFNAIRRRHPGLDGDELGLRFIELAYGQKLADEIAHWKARPSD